ncbi:hypothetical protein GDO86_011443 [Hymenochirus boettgeri]|uniref:C2H2-type domain-containing protein n=1 Tax=Hymenochirus boettgeri TaxID=247094 RepID=A0A8T2JGM7_9PIPI|nr:hypothetical protein GDO86_011443 [Hymenochirus boettgeri]
MHRGRRHGNKRGSSDDWQYKRYTKIRFTHKCAVCNIVCTSANQLDEHFLGAKHKMNEKKQRSSEEENNLSKKVSIKENIESLEIEHPTSPASSGYSCTESVPPISATGNVSDTQSSIEKPQIENADNVSAVPLSPLSQVSSCESSNSAPEAESLSEGSESREHLHWSKSEELGTKNIDSALIVVENNEDLYQFMEKFEVATESDVSFILKVTEKFRHALQNFNKGILEKKVDPEASPTQVGYFGDLSSTTDTIKINSAEASLMETETPSPLPLAATCSDEEDEY